MKTKIEVDGSLTLSIPHTEVVGANTNMNRVTHITLTQEQAMALLNEIEHYAHTGELPD